MNLKYILKRRAILIVLGTSISSLTIVNNPIFVNASNVDTSIVLEEDAFDEKKYELEEREDYYINKDFLEISKTRDEVLYSSILIGSTIGLVGVKNKLKKKKIK